MLTVSTTRAPALLKGLILSTSDRMFVQITFFSMESWSKVANRVCCIGSLVLSSANSVPAQLDWLSIKIEMELNEILCNCFLKFDLDFPCVFHLLKNEFSTFKDVSFIIEKYSKFFNGISFSVPK